MILTQLSEELFNKISKLIEDETGIHYKKSKILLLSNRIKKRIRYLKLSSFEEYYDYLIKNLSKELKQLFNVITTGETYFFRNYSYFELLKELVQINLINNNKKEFTIWSAGCSSGEESYSIAIILMEVLHDISKYNISVIGSDINRYNLEKAKAGIYEYKSFKEMPAEYIKRYFKKIQINDRMLYEIIPEIKSMVEFRYLNLLKDAFPRKVDVIFCRNVLIYMQSFTQKYIIDRFYNSLNKNGYLFFGSSEVLLIDNTRFETIRYKTARIYRKK